MMCVEFLLIMAVRIGPLKSLFYLMGFTLQKGEWRYLFL